MKATACKTTKNSAYIKIPRCILNHPDTKQLLDIEGATGLGTYLAILIHLTLYKDCIGSLDSREINKIADDCKKSAKYIRHIIEDFDLFVIEDKKYWNSSLYHSFKISEEKILKSSENDSRIIPDSFQNEQSDDLYNKNAHTYAQNNNNNNNHNNNNKEYSTTSSSNILKAKDGTLASSSKARNSEAEAESLSLRINKIFADEKWVKAATVLTGITFTHEKMDICSNTWMECGM